MIWAIFGFAGFGVLGFAAWWLIRLGKHIHEGEDATKSNIELEGQAKERNQFIKDIDEISKAKDANKKKARDAFRRGNVGDLVRVLDESRIKNPTANKT